MKIFLAFIMILIIQTGHIFVHLTSAELPRYAQNGDLLWSSLLILRYKFYKVWIVSTSALYDMGPR